MFEFGTLNGGEHSMLACLERLTGEFEFTAIAPASGPLADALAERNVTHQPFDVRDPSGERREPSSLRSELLELVTENQADLLHANSLSMSRLTGSLGDRVPVQRTGHLRDIVKLSRAAVADLNRNDRLVAVSEATNRFHVERGLHAARTVVLHNGVDLERFRPRPRTGGLQRELGVDPAARIALVVGQIGLRKGQDVLAAAVAHVDVPDLHVVLVGERLSQKAESVAFERAIADGFAAAGWPDRLHRLGYRDDVPWLMNEADLLIHPAKQEPLGRVLLEAAASGLPIVATDVGGTREILEEDAAWLVPAGDARTLATATTTVMADERERRARAERARAEVELRFDADLAARRLGEFWRETCP